MTLWGMTSTPKNVAFWLPEFIITHLSSETNKFLATFAKCNMCRRKVGELPRKLPVCPCQNYESSEGTLKLLMYRMPRDQFKKFDKYFVEDLCRGRTSSLHDIVRSLTRRARMKNIRGKHTAEDVSSIWNLQKGGCYFCLVSLGNNVKEKKFSKDHLVPVFDGGTNWPDNIVLVCKNCNDRKSILSESQFWISLKKRRGGSMWVKKRMRIAEEIRKERMKLGNRRRASARKKGN